MNNIDKIRKHLKEINKLLPTVEGYHCGYKEPQTNYITIRCSDDLLEKIENIARAFDEPVGRVCKELIIKGLTDYEQKAQKLIQSIMDQK